MTFMRKIMDLLDMNNWGKNIDKSDVSHKLINKGSAPLIPSCPSYFEQLQIEEDFQYIPFIKHCSTSYNKQATNYIYPNLTEQHEILYYIDSFNDSITNIQNKLFLDDFHIYTESVKFDYRYGNIAQPKTFIEFSPYTKTGKKSKYPISVIFTTEESDSNVYYIQNQEYETGRIEFMIDGNIGKARITFFRKNYIYGITYKMFGVSLLVDKITQSERIGDTKKIYKNGIDF